jgi:hypothetical protein
LEININYFEIIVFFYLKISNRSRSTLHIGQISGGCSLAHKYPQTLHLHIGVVEDDKISLMDLFFKISRCSGEGLLSGIDFNFDFPFNISPEMYKPQ